MILLAVIEPGIGQDLLAVEVQEYGGVPNARHGELGGSGLKRRPEFCRRRVWGTRSNDRCWLGAPNTGGCGRRRLASGPEREEHGANEHGATERPHGDAQSSRWSEGGHTAALSDERRPAIGRRHSRLPQFGFGFVHGFVSS